jgi:O-antigen/teichoic acid export membrane protein
VNWFRIQIASAMRSELIRKISAVFMTQVLRLLMSFAASVVVARVLGPTNRGFFALASATGALGVQFANLGLHTSNTYFSARDQKSLPILLGNTLLVSFGFGTLVSVALWLLSHYIGFIGLRGGIFVLALIWIPVGLAYLLGQNLLLGIQQISAFNLAEILNKALPIILIGVLLIAHVYTVEAMFGATLAGLVAGCGYIFYRLVRQIASWPTISGPFMRENLVYATKAYLAALFCFLVIRSDLFLIQALVGVEQAGYYSVAVTLAEAFSLLPASVAMIVFPRFAESRDIQDKLQLVWKASIVTAAVLVPVLTVIGLLSRLTIVTLFGHAFEQSSLAFVLLLPGIFFLGMHSVIVQLLNGIGYPRSVVYIWGLCAVLNITANWFVIPRFGIAGASVTSSISYLLAFLLVAFVILRLRFANIPSPLGQGVSTA